MVKILMKFEVEDFAKWKEGFKVAEGLRNAAGAKGVQVLRGDDNPKLVAVITEWDDVESAKSFSQNPALKEAQKKAGVRTLPEVAVLQAL
jgi:heme-degrading monooxygenase HmoA